jgi:hypothetical protein
VLTSQTRKPARRELDAIQSLYLLSMPTTPPLCLPEPLNYRKIVYRKLYVHLRILLSILLLYLLRNITFHTKPSMHDSRDDFIE